MGYQILIVEDDPASLEELVPIVQSAGGSISSCSTPQEALAMMNKSEFDVVMTDLHTDGRGEIDLLKKVKKASPNTIVIIITGSSSVERAVEAMNHGAYHYLTKPYRGDEVRALLHKAHEKRLMRMELEELRGMVGGLKSPKLIGKSPAMQELQKHISIAAPLDCTILIEGETGTGKELISRFIHQRSKRADMDFLAINCGTFSKELLANELFGHEREAFTGAQRMKHGVFESVDGGTLLLDEIGEIPGPTQVSLLRVLQEQAIMRVGGTEEIPVDVRVLAATNRDLRKEVAEGRFREDLLYRLNVFVLRVPPLRERADDIPLFCKSFVAQYSEKYDKEVEGVSEEVMGILVHYPFPGNVRELKNVIERAVILADGPLVERKDLPRRFRTHGKHGAEGRPTEFVTLAEMEERYIRDVLEHVGGNKTQASKVLGIDRASLWRKLKKMGAQ